MFTPPITAGTRSYRFTAELGHADALGLKPHHIAAVGDIVFDYKDKELDELSEEETEIKVLLGRDPDFDALRSASSLVASDKLGTLAVQYYSGSGDLLYTTIVTNVRVLTARLCQLSLGDTEFACVALGLSYDVADVSVLPNEKNLQKALDEAKDRETKHAQTA